MYASESLTTAGENWKDAGNALIDQAERIAPLEPGVFGELGTDDELEAEARSIDDQVDAFLSEGDRAFAELAQPAETSIDARFQANSLLVGSLAVAEALAAADEAPSDVFGELGIEPDQPVTFTDARATIDAAGAIVVGAALPAAAAVPATLATSLEDIESAGAKEAWAVASSSAGRLAGGALVSGIQGVLRGTAAAAFKAVLDQLSRWRDALKRGVTRIARWVIDKLKSLLPKAAQSKVDALIKEVQEKLETGVGEIATDVFGQMLGRADAEAAWTEAAGAGKDLTEAESKLAGIAELHTDRIGWVTKGRKVIDKFDKVLSGVVAHLPAQAKLAYAALVAAVVAFVAFQTWDGFNDIEALV